MLNGTTQYITWKKKTKHMNVNKIRAYPITRDKQDGRHQTRANNKRIKHDSARQQKTKLIQDHNITKHQTAKANGHDDARSWNDAPRPPDGHDHGGAVGISIFSASKNKNENNIVKINQSAYQSKKTKNSNSSYY